MKQNKSFLLFILVLTNFFHIVDAMMIMPLGDIFITEFDLSAAQFSILVSSYSIAAFFSNIIGVFYLDIFDRKRVLLTVSIGFALGTFLCCYASTYSQLVSLRVLTGVFGGMIGAMILSIVSDLYKFKERGMAMGAMMAAFSAASALGVPFALYLAAIKNWHLPFFILGIGGFGVSMIILFFFPSMKGHLKELDPNRSIKNTLSTIYNDANQVNALTLGALLVLAHFLIIPFISPYLVKNVGFSQMDISYQFFFGGVATIISGPIIGKLVDKKGVIPIFYTVMVISFIPTLVITNLGMVSVAVGLIFTTLFFIFATGRMISANTLITAAAPPGNRGSFMSFKSALQQLMVAISALIGGQVIYLNNTTDQFENYNYIGYLAVLFGLITMWWIRKLKVAKGN